MERELIKIWSAGCRKIKLGRLKRKNDLQLVSESGFFDAQHYLSQNPDIAKEGSDPLLHFMEVGWMELRNPGPQFHTSHYLATYPDVREANVNPLVHYVKHGRKEGRIPSPKLNPSKYPRKNLDTVKANYKSKKITRYISWLRGKLDQKPLDQDLYELLSPHFDEFYYQAQRRDLKNKDKRLLIEDYIQTGYKKGLDPSRDFSTSYYLKQNNDVAINNINPFVHYVKLGFSEGRKPRNTHPVNIYSNSPPPTNDFKIAVCAHIYYIDLLDDVFEATQNIINASGNATCYISTTTEHYHIVDEALDDKGWDYKIITPRNIGYDIYPFLKAAEHAFEDGCDLVCKLHTKKGSANLENIVENIDAVWANMLIDPIAGSVETVLNVLAAFSENRDIDMVGAAQVYKSVKHLIYDNGSEMHKLLKQLEPAMDFRTDAGFFAGSMFWARSSLIAKLYPLITELEKTASEEGQKTGSYASVWHAIERLFGILPNIESKHTGLSYASDFSAKHYYIEVPQGTSTSSADRATYIGVGMTLQSEHDLHANMEVLGDQLNIDPYQLSLPVKLSKRNALAHYLRYGIFQKTIFPGGFDHHAYWAENPDALIQRKNPFIHSIAHPENNTLPAPVNYLEIYNIIRKSNLFDEAYYRTVNYALPRRSDAL
ncbi:MAG: rhamnan synthesis F family protein, partial [Verrucomicrobiales bacterium]|nr:rhamnan synthesis F family protein [Verrucomicrobiales bacterium]